MLHDPIKKIVKRDFSHLTKLEKKEIVLKLMDEDDTDNVLNLLANEYKF